MKNKQDELYFIIQRADLESFSNPAGLTKEAAERALLELQDLEDLVVVRGTLLTPKIRTTFSL